MASRNDRFANRMAGYLFFFYLLIHFTGCAAFTSGRFIKEGDSAMIHCLCMTRERKLLFPFKPDSPAVNIEKSESLKSLRVTAGEQVSKRSQGSIKMALQARLAREIVGKRIGESHNLELTLEDHPFPSRQEGLLSVARVRRRPKRIVMNIDEFHLKLKHLPVIGEEIIFDPAFPGRVHAITDTSVDILFTAQADPVIDTPYGMGTIVEKEDHYEIMLDAHVGDFVEIGGLIGRISTVDERLILIDYFDPFEGEPLICNYTIESLN